MEGYNNNVERTIEFWKALWKARQNGLKAGKAEPIPYEPPEVIQHNRPYAAYPCVCNPIRIVIHKEETNDDKR